jgi:hypothetical protein
MAKYAVSDSWIAIVQAFDILHNGVSHYVYFHVACAWLSPRELWRKWNTFIITFISSDKQEEDIPSIEDEIPIGCYVILIGKQTS